MKGLIVDGANAEVVTVRSPWIKDDTHQLDFRNVVKLASGWDHKFNLLGKSIMFS